MKKQILLGFSILLLCFSAVSAQKATKSISGGVLNGKAISLPKPEITAAKAVGACGSVSVEVLIDETGDVIEAAAVSGHPLLRGSAVQAARQAKFNPTKLSGQLVKVSGIITYVFATCKTAYNESPQRKDNSENQTTENAFINDKALSLPKPEYPAAAKAVGAEGKVEVRVLIDEDGNVTFAKAISGHPLLRQPAEQAARQATFPPTIIAGQHVENTGIVAYNFVIFVSDNDFREKTKDFREKTKILELGAVFSFFDPMLDSHKDSNSDFKVLVRKYSAKYPQLADDFKKLLSLNKETPKTERTGNIDKTFTAVKAKLKPSEAWQLETGKHIGKLMVIFKEVEPEEVNESALRIELLKIRDLIFSAPNDFPAEALNLFKTLAKFADDQNLNKGENKTKVFEAVYNLIGTIFPYK